MSLSVGAAQANALQLAETIAALYPIVMKVPPEANALEVQEKLSSAISALRQLRTGETFPDEVVQTCTPVIISGKKIGDALSGPASRNEIQNELCLEMYKLKRALEGDKLYY